MIKYIVTIKHKYPFGVLTNDKTIEYDNKDDARESVHRNRLTITLAAQANGNSIQEYKCKDLDYILEEREWNGNLIIAHCISCEKILKDD